jgi:hypothetical protein
MKRKKWVPVMQSAGLVEVNDGVRELGQIPPIILMRSNLEDRLLLSISNHLRLVTLSIDLKNFTHMAEIAH